MNGCQFMKKRFTLPAGPQRTTPKTADWDDVFGDKRDECTSFCPRVGQTIRICEGGVCPECGSKTNHLKDKLNG